MSNAVEDAHQALVDALNAYVGGEVLVPGLAQRDQTLPVEETRLFLNVVPGNGVANVTGEQLGLGEDAIIVEFEQPFDVEWIVRDDDDAARRSTFGTGLAEIAAALFADRALGGKASGLSLGQPEYVNHTFAGAPNTAACVIPVLVSLRGLGSVIS